MPLCRQDISKPESNQDIYKAIEKLTVMVEALGQKLDGSVSGMAQEPPMQLLMNQNEQLSNQIEQLSMKMQLLMNQNEQLSNQIEQLSMKVQQPAQPTEQLNQNEEQKENMQPQTPLIKQLSEKVRTFNVDHNWMALQIELEFVLGSYNTVYRQLMDVYEDDVPLHTICIEGYVELMTVLLDAGLDPNLQTKWESETCTLFHVVVGRGHVQLAEIFLNYGADIEAKTSSHHTPIAFATRFGHLKMVQWLNNQGANVNSLNEDGQSVLHIAVYEGRLNIVKYLVSVRADTTYVWQGYGSPMQTANLNHKLEIAKFLSNYPH